MLNIWKQASQDARVTDFGSQPKTSEKRARETQEDATTQGTRSLKRVRVERAESPENLQELLNQLHHRNIIFQVEGIASRVTISIGVLDALCAFEKHHASRSRRTALLLVKDDISVPVYASSLRNLRPNHIGLDFTVYDPSDNSSSQLGNLSQTDVIVLHSHAFLSSLTEGGLSISQIHTLIVYDLENVQSSESDPVVRVMMDFYRLADPLSRPRILAMVTPLSVDVGPHLFDLENMFEAHTFGVEHPQRQDFKGVPKGLTELTILFDSVSEINPPNHSLQKSLPSTVVTTKAFELHLRDSAYVYGSLGSTASDLYWQLLAKDMEATLLPSEDEVSQQLESALTSDHTKRLIVNAIKSSIPTVTSLKSTLQDCNVTPKFIKLIQILRSCKPYGVAFRAIIFVSNHNVALILVDMLKSHDLEFVRPHAICTRNCLTDGMHTDGILKDFTSGTLNLLVATKSMEDLDFPVVSIVIRFDHFESHVSYAFCRAIAANQLVHMIERGNVTEHCSLRRTTHTSGALEEWMARISEPTGAIPPPSLHETKQSLDSTDDDESDNVFILDPTTSFRLYPHHSLRVIYLLAAKLAESNPTYINRPLFEYTQCPDGSNICIVLLPPGLPFQKISGSAFPSKVDARRSACYQTSRRVFDEGLLDYRYFPSSRDARLALFASTKKGTHNKGEQQLGDEPKTSGVRSYPRRAPDFWSNSTNPSLASSNRLFPTVIFSVQAGEDLSPIVLLTRLPLPDLPSFDLFFSGKMVNICLRKGSPLSVEDWQTRDLRRYTLRLHRMIGNKPFVCEQQSMPYFLAPLAHSWVYLHSKQPLNLYDLPNVASHIPWDAVSLAASRAFVHMKTDTSQAIEDELHNAVIQDRWVEYTRRYFVVKIRHDMSPLHKPGEGEREAEYDTYLEYCRARVSGFEGLKYPDTPLIQVQVAPGILNHLDPTLKPQLPAKGAAKYLIPELCSKCTIPASTLKTALAFPSILTRIDEFLLTKELNSKLFSDRVSEKLLQAALTPPSVGADMNYERLETLGDAILKYMSSAYVFIVQPSDMEGALHRSRRRIIANKTLWYSATQIGIPQFIISKFSAKHWYPANFIVRDSFNYVADDAMEPEASLNLGFKRHKGQFVHQLGDKTLADTMEAIVAAAYLSGGNRAMVTAMNSLTIAVLEYDRTSDIGRKALPLPPSPVSSLIPMASILRVEKIIGHNFRYPYYLVQVLTRVCLSGFESTWFERLEFLGDGILDFLTMRYIYEREPDLPPGALTLLKSAMVSNSTLATLCVQSGIYEFVDSRAHRLGDTLQHYAAAVKAKHTQEHQLAEKENRPPGQYWRELECPKVVSDVMEAILGALYVSDNCCLVGAEKFFDNVFKPFYNTHITLKSLSRHATTTILELFQKRRCDQYRLLKENRGGQTHCKVILHGSLLGEATDSVASTAMRRACELSLQMLIKDPKTCNCDVSKIQVEKAAKNAAEALNGASRQVL